MENIIDTTGIAVPEVARIAEQRLEELVANGKRNASATVERVFTQIPEDHIVKQTALAFSTQPNGRVYMMAGDSSWALHDNAFGQVAERAHVPTKYLRELTATDEKESDGTMVVPQWRRELVDHVLREHMSHSPSRALVRAIGGQARAVLSDKYRRLDSRPLLESFVNACNSIGAVPIEGSGGDLRVFVRAIVPTIYSPFPGEFLVFGLDWSNSDFGAGSYQIATYVHRLVCVNGMVGQNQIRQIHVGGRLPDNLEFSQRTYQLDTKTMVSATNDLVRGALGPKPIESLVESIRASASQETSFVKAHATVAKALTKGESEKLRQAFDGPDVINLPPAKTPYRFAQALGWIAREAEPERKAELQTLAGKFVQAA